MKVVKLSLTLLKFGLKLGISIKAKPKYFLKKLCFFLDFGNLKVGKEVTLAKDALYFMVVSVNDSWRLPFGYFFVAGLNAKGKSVYNLYYFF